MSGARKRRVDFGSANVVRSCDRCGAAFTIKKSEAKYRPARYCSVKCGGEARFNKLYHGIIEDNSIPEPNSGCWLWLGATNSFGYGAIRIANKQWHGHRLSYVLAYGEPPASRPVIRHLCNNPACVNPTHLSAGTVQDNVQDRLDAGHQIHGSQHKLAKLTEEDIPKIVLAARVGVSQRALAEKYGVHQRAITFVLQGVTWRRASGL